MVPALPTKRRTGLAATENPYGAIENGIAVKRGLERRQDAVTQAHKVSIGRSSQSGIGTVAASRASLTRASRFDKVKCALPGVRVLHSCRLVVELLNELLSDGSSCKVDRIR